MIARRLWRVPVEITLDMLVVAANEEEARATARDYLDDEINDYLHADLAYVGPGKRLHEPQEVPKEWKGSCPYFPRGAERNDTAGPETVEEWLALPPTAEELEAAGQLTLLEGA